MHRNLGKKCRTLRKCRIYNNQSNKESNHHKRRSKRKCRTSANVLKDVRGAQLMIIFGYYKM